MSSRCIRNEKKQTKKGIRKIIILLLFLFGCTNSVINSDIQATRPPSEINTKSTITYIISTAPPTTPTVAIVSTDKCYSERELWKNSSLDISLPGKMLVIKGNQSYLFDPKNNKNEEFPKTSYYFSVSPDNTKYSYVYRDNSSPTGEKFVARDINGNEKTRNFPIDLSWMTSYQKWVNNEYLVFNLRTPVEENAVYPQVIFDPFSGQTQELPSDFPNLNSANSGLANHLFTNSDMSYNPTLQYLVYLESEDGYNFVLWDRKSNKAIAKIPTEWNHGSYPLWSQDGNTVYFPITIFYQEEMYSEWYSIQTNGAVQKITKFSEFKNKPYIFYPSLSPDGKQLAYSYEYAQGETRSDMMLSVLNLETGVVNDLCIPSEFKGQKILNWSPDSQFLVANRYNDAILFDLKNHWQGVLFSDARVGGWLK